MTFDRQLKFPVKAIRHITLFPESRRKIMDNAKGNRAIKHAGDRWPRVTVQITMFRYWCIYKGCPS